GVVHARAGPAVLGEPPDPDSGLRLLGDGRGALRLLAGAQGREPQPDRSAPSRVAPGVTPAARARERSRQNDTTPAATTRHQPNTPSPRRFSQSTIQRTASTAASQA